MSPSELRQAWLEQAVKQLRPYFKIWGATIPDTLRVSIGFTSTRKHIGECYYSTASSDGHREIFVSPVVADSAGLLGTLAHELCHAALPDGEGHGKAFRALATRIGLEGKMTATTTGERLKVWVDAFIGDWGEYPAGSITRSSMKKQKTYLVKVECLSCGYVARTTSKWLEDIGSPLCACNHEAMEISE